ncbi:unnamed protein product, partial [Rotaria sp. Silwood1]
MTTHQFGGILATAFFIP